MTKMMSVLGCARKRMVIAKTRSLTLAGVCSLAKHSKQSLLFFFSSSSSSFEGGKDREWETSSAPEESHISICISVLLFVDFYLIHYVVCLHSFKRDFLDDHAAFCR